ncbi:MAG: GNAT family N-acetyltransferase [Crocinitomicaceae bacterium]|nr:GNAT family N-acetyltransferase [Crocinitomicaceae bacterium]|tara:strand:+ start:1374 stop:1754 length:381 start_codon:yes stop_codon:yes gene_type:complete
MNIEIRKYDPLKDNNGLLEIIKSEGEEWKDYLNPKYRKVLEGSITYVAQIEEQICGYSRSINDSGLYIWIIDLLAHKKYRGHTIGKKLLECLIAAFPGQDVFVMSDVDEYYKKLGYKNEGTIFKVE